MAHLREDNSGKRLGVLLSDGPCDRDRTHGARKDKRRDDDRLTRAGIDLERCEHAVIQPARATDVDQRHQTRLLPDLIRAEEDFGQCNAVGGVLAGSHGAHKSLIAVFDVAENHIQMAGVNMLVCRLNNGPAGMMDIGAHVR